MDLKAFCSSFTIKIIHKKVSSITLNIRRQVSWFFQNIISSFHSFNMYGVTVEQFLVGIPSCSVSSLIICGSLGSYESNECFIGEFMFLASPEKFTRENLNFPH